MKLEVAFFYCQIKFLYLNNGLEKTKEWKCVFHFVHML